MNDPTTAAHLQLVIDHWGDLRDALATRQADTWPPAMGISRLVRTIEQEEDALARAAAERAERNGDAPGPRPAPLRVEILDAMVEAERTLVDTADQIASAVQRPPVARVRSAGPADATGLQLATLTLADQADGRRWSYTDPRMRTAPFAAVWLLARLEGVPGPFGVLGGVRTDQITTAARSAAQHIVRGLEMARRSEGIEQPCPHCRGRLRIHGGDGQDPAVRCQGCGRTWRAQGAAVA